MADTVLEEVFDPTYEPTQLEIEEYAEFLGMNLDEDESFLWIAREGLKAPLPSEWKPCQTDTSQVYYFNFITKESIWEHPCDEKYRNMYAQEKSKMSKDPIAGNFQPSETKDLNANVNVENVTESTSLHQSEEYTNTSQSKKSDTEGVARLPLVPILPKLDMRTYESALPPLPKQEIPRLSSREMPGPQLASVSRQGSQLDLLHSQAVYQENMSGKAICMSDKLYPSSTQLKKLTSSNTTSSSDIAQCTSSHQIRKSHSNMKISESRSRSESRISLPSVRLPSLTSMKSIQMEQTVQKQIHQQADDIAQLESEISELGDRVRGADKVNIERLTQDQGLIKLRPRLSSDDLRNDLQRKHEQEIHQIRLGFEDRISNLKARMSSLENENIELCAKVRNCVLKQQAAEQQLLNKGREISRLEQINAVQLDKLKILETLNENHQRAEIDAAAHANQKDDHFLATLQAQDSEQNVNLVQKLKHELKLAHGNIRELTMQMSDIQTKSDEAARRFEQELIDVKGQSTANLHSNQAIHSQSISTQTDNHQPPIKLEIALPEHQQATDPAKSLPEFNDIDHGSISRSSSSTVSMYQEESSCHSYRRTSIQLNMYEKSPRPPLLKSRITYDQTLFEDESLSSVSNLDSELLEVEESLNHVLHRVQNRCQLSVPTPDDELFNGNDIYDRYALECSATEQKLREHTSWLKTFLDQLDSSVQ